MIFYLEPPIVLSSPFLAPFHYHFVCSFEILCSLKIPSHCRHVNSFRGCSSRRSHPRYPSVAPSTRQMADLWQTNAVEAINTALSII